MNGPAPVRSCNVRSADHPGAASDATAASPFLFQRQDIDGEVVKLDRRQSKVWHLRMRFG
jgi:hypothetical protein